MQKKVTDFVLFVWTMKSKNTSRMAVQLKVGENSKTVKPQL